MAFSPVTIFNPNQRLASRTYGVSSPVLIHSQHESKLLKQGIAFRLAWVDERKTVIDPLVLDHKVTLYSAPACEADISLDSPIAHVITDPPYVGNV